MHTPADIRIKHAHRQAQTHIAQGHTHTHTHTHTYKHTCAHRHPEFLAGNITTSFIEKYSKDLFDFEGHQSESSSKLLVYLANMVC